MAGSMPLETYRDTCDRVTPINSPASAAERYPLMVELLMVFSVCFCCILHNGVLKELLRQNSLHGLGIISHGRGTMSLEHPSPEELLEGIPSAHWRECHDCGNISIHADNVTPHVICRQCKSRDTRPMKNANAQLRRAAGITWD